MLVVGSLHNEVRHHNYFTEVHSTKHSHKTDSSNKLFFINICVSFDREV